MNRDLCSRADDEESPARLRWRSRRGLRELDLMLERYLESGYPQADAEERQAFARLLECADPDLVAWLLGQTPAPAGLEHVVRAIAAAR
ncbi:MAG TPA: succinate dehydrogenase assembly factor 2 [Gammaproteobacteria bacterium]|nr:succinate dehydrogenase assembly factor 2 [Gammaproteobacteria bacterium]